ncbi:MAG: zinc ribbon domain-containing protein, partial [Oscillospiraceae bacterium]
RRGAAKFDSEGAVMMDEKLQELLNLVQKTAEDVANGAVSIAYLAGKKADKMVSLGKLKNRISACQTQVEEQLQEIGELVYGTHVGAPTDSDVLFSKLQTIDALKAEIASLNRELAALRGTGVCPICGAVVQKDDGFCKDCGAEITPLD